MTRNLLAAALLLGGSIASHGATRVSAKVAAPKQASDWRVTAGLTVPGINGSIMGRVYNKRFPVYMGGELDALFLLGYYGIGGGVVLMPQFSVAMQIPIKGGIITPTFGISMGPTVVLTEYGGGVGFGMMFKPGMLVEIEKNMELDVQLRMGSYGYGFGVMPLVGMRFAL